MHQFELPNPVLLSIKLGHGAAHGLSIKRVSWGYRKIPLSHGRHHIGRIVPCQGHPVLAVESVSKNGSWPKHLPNGPNVSALPANP